MQEFLDIAFHFPALPLTVVGITVLVYWLTVILGALDIDLLDPADGDMELEVDAADAEVGDIEAGADDTGEGPSGLAALLGALRLRYAPVTVSLSLIVLFAWMMSFQAAWFLLPRLAMSGWVAGTLTLFISLALAVPLTSLATRPLRRLFVTHRATRRKDLIGQVVRVRIGADAGKSGQGELKDRGAGLLLSIRDIGGSSLEDGQDALIVNYDEEQEFFEVERLEELLPAGGHRTNEEKEN